MECALAENGVDWSSAARRARGARINVVSSQEAKGLEFDAVVVVEPEHVVAGDDRGHRMLYIALTRTTGHLDIIALGDPLPLTTHAPPLLLFTPDPFDAGGSSPAEFTDRDAQRLADHLASRLRSSA